MKIMIEVSGGVVCGVTATEECKIYLIDHDNLKEKGGDTKHARQFLTPDCVTGELDTDDNDESPEFDNILNEALSEY